MSNANDRTQLLLDALAERILVTGGPYGTYLHGRDLTAADYGGAQHEGCPEHLNLTRPDVIEDAHRGYLEAGADIIETNTFGGGSIVLAEYGLRTTRARDQRGRGPPRRATSPRDFSTPARPALRRRLHGPDDEGASPSPAASPSTSWPTSTTAGRLGLVDGGADLLLLETQDTRNIKAALLGIERVFDEAGFRLPVMVSGTIEPKGTMLAGQTVDALAASLEHADLLSLGLNCATGPEFMTDHLRTLAELTRVPHRPVCRTPACPTRTAATSRRPMQMARRARALRRPRLAQHRRRLLRHHVRAHRALFAQMAEGKRPRAAGEAPPRALRRHRPRRGRRRQPPADRRRAHQRDRLAQVQAPDRRREVRGGERDRPPPGQERRADHRRLPAERRPRRAARHRPLLRAADPEDQGADHDRHHRPRRASSARSRTARASRSSTRSTSRTARRSSSASAPLARTYGAALVVGCIDEDKEQAQAFTRERKLDDRRSARASC